MMENIVNPRAVGVADACERALPHVVQKTEMLFEMATSFL